MEKNILTSSVLSLILLILSTGVLENIGNIYGFITVIAVGLVDSNWILAMDTGHSVVLFGIVGSTVYCCFVCNLS